MSPQTQSGRDQQQLAAAIEKITNAHRHASVAGIARGIEKESLRVSPNGHLARTAHPSSLGSALTHPEITTDFSESLLEFITAPHKNVDTVLNQLDAIHRYVYQSLDNEILWVNSMPCVLADDNSIPVAQYGKSNVAKMKTIYRLGLGARYGRAMQTIAGIHYNFSLPDDFWRELHAIEKSQLTLKEFKTKRYFDLIRNFRRYFWLLIYLFGASPAICPSFVKGREHTLSYLTPDQHTLFGNDATALRMGDLGYQSNAQQSLVVNYNDLPNYLATLYGAINLPHPDYQKIGLKDANGNYLQLNEGLLQIENEFYSTIRPKRTTQSGETALCALFERGVEYIEVRCLDLNPFEPLGITREQIHFIDSFLVFCLLAESPQADESDYRRVQNNQQLIVNRGRDPDLLLETRTGDRNCREWANALLDRIADTAQLLDEAQGVTEHTQAVANQRQKVDDASLTPSGQLLSLMNREEKSFYTIALEQAKTTANYFNDRPLADDITKRYQLLAADSLVAQERIENNDDVDFEEYRREFYAQYACCTEPCS